MPPHASPHLPSCPPGAQPRQGAFSRVTAGFKDAAEEVQDVRPHYGRTHQVESRLADTVLHGPGHRIAVPDELPPSPAAANDPQLRGGRSGGGEVAFSLAWRHVNRNLSWSVAKRGLALRPDAVRRLSEAVSRLFPQAGALVILVHSIPG